MINIKHLIIAYLLVFPFPLMAVTEYTLAELTRYAEHFAGISENRGPNIELNPEDQAIVQEYKEFFEDYQAKMAEYSAIPRRDKDRRREYVRVNFALDQVDFPELDKVGKFVNFYWFHKRFAHHKEGGNTKVNIEGPREGKSGAVAKRPFQLSEEEYQKYIEAHKKPHWHEYYGWTPEEYIQYLQTNFSATTNSPCAHPDFKTSDRGECGLCWRMLQKKLLIYDMEDWENKSPQLQSDPDLAKRTGRTFEEWQQCAGYLEQLEKQGYL